MAALTAASDFGAGVPAVPIAADSSPSKPPGHATAHLQGWTVQIDTRLQQPEHAELGRRAEKLLSARLADIVTALPADKVARLRQVPIWLDLSCGDLKGMQYHPSADWLKDHGHDPAMARGVHIARADVFVSARHQQIQPWCVLHELAHAYHDQVLGFANPEVKKVWDDYVASGHGERALNFNGNEVRHYAMTNEKEFFAEMTEAYFGANDFFPYVYGELKQAEPEIYGLLRKLWGPAPIEKGA
jgi:hypothetical protein